MSSCRGSLAGVRGMSHYSTSSSASHAGDNTQKFAQATIMDSTPKARSLRSSFSSSLLSDPPSDIDEQESPFSPSPKKRSKRTISHIVAHAVIRRQNESSLVGDETPQQTWQRRYGNAPFQPPQDLKQFEQAFFREIINRVEDKGRKIWAYLEKQLMEKDKRIGDLEQLISCLEGRNAELCRSSENSTDAEELVSDENSDRKLKVRAKVSR